MIAIESRVRIKATGEEGVIVSRFGPRYQLLKIQDGKVGPPQVFCDESDIEFIAPMPPPWDWV